MFAGELFPGMGWAGFPLYYNTHRFNIIPGKMEVVFSFP